MGNVLHFSNNFIVSRIYRTTFTAKFTTINLSTILSRFEQNIGCLFYIMIELIDDIVARVSFVNSEPDVEIASEIASAFSFKVLIASGHSADNGKH